MSNDKVVYFGAEGQRHRERKQHERKESRADAIRARFSAALPAAKATPVKDYFNKKRAKKKR
ncbi:tRNA (uracil-5-)-methyltransferase [Marinobacterium weihaiense]|uniref:tRNA (Uracil-5-)-methyltransferase n=1 Tax=Marinobacterium weihaiense TaxID=2851016 RepID=A0ABS6M756_9GAMM|nr:tRNA (uracil-5-)-methyltransferase [Marinobacterium weihaiense]MBV0932114.1 tRNA (uracil-5-)-methyltransferase [Marinobacterium weihaiense]